MKKIINWFKKDPILGVFLIGVFISITVFLLTIGTCNQ